jgi:hypothetical protein
MRKLAVCLAVVLGVASLICARPRPKSTTAATDSASITWDLSRTRSPHNIGWADDAAAGDYWTGHRSQLTLNHPSGRQISFENADFAAKRERGSLSTIRISRRGLTHEQMLKCCRSFCDTWAWPATSARLTQLYGTPTAARSAPATWLAQTPGVALRVSQDGPDTKCPWYVELDFNFKP